MLRTAPGTKAERAPEHLRRSAGRAVERRPSLPLASLVGFAAGPLCLALALSIAESPERRLLAAASVIFIAVGFSAADSPKTHSDK